MKLGSFERGRIKADLSRSAFWSDNSEAVRLSFEKMTLGDLSKSPNFSNALAIRGLFVVRPGIKWAD